MYMYVIYLNDLTLGYSCLEFVYLQCVGQCQSTWRVMNFILLLINQLLTSTNFSSYTYIYTNDTRLSRTSFHSTFSFWPIFNFIYQKHPQVPYVCIHNIVYCLDITQSYIAFIFCSSVLKLDRFIFNECQVILLAGK